jgi:hypothetical protein
MSTSQFKKFSEGVTEPSHDAAPVSPRRQYLISATVVEPNQPAGDRPLRTRHWFDESGQVARNTETHPMTEDRLGDFLETLELRGATREHHPGPWDSIQALAH